MLFLLPDSVVQWAVDVNVRVPVEQVCQWKSWLLQFRTLSMDREHKQTRKQQMLSSETRPRGTAAVLPDPADHVSANVYRLVCV